MPTFPFKGVPSSRPSSVESPDRPAKWPPDGDSKERAVTHLLQHGVLSHTVGRGMEYKVRTTLVTQRIWHYRCEVFCHDKPMKWAFSPIAVDRTSQILQVDSAPESIKVVRLNLAEEAVGVHFTRCAVLREYLTLASIYAQPTLATPRRYPRSVFLVGVALLTAFGLWILTPRPHNTTPPVRSPTVAQQTPQPVVAPTPAPAPVPIPLPPANSASSAEIPARPSAAPEATPVVTAPKHVLLSDLLSLVSSVETPVPDSPAEAATGKTVSEAQAGDFLRFTGWLHWISLTPSGTYQLYVTPSPRSKAPGLIAAVPPPDQPAGPPAMEKQLQAVRSFITQRLLRQQKPSTRRAVMRKPIFIQLMGQLSSPDVSPLAEPAGSKGEEEATAGWGVQPLLEVQFATPPASSSRSRSQ